MGGEKDYDIRAWILLLEPKGCWKANEHMMTLHIFETHL